MNQGVQIIIERIKSNPEDFEPLGRFSYLIDELSDLCGEDLRVRSRASSPLFFLTDTEKQALIEVWTERLRNKFTRDVMTALLREKEDLPVIQGGITIGQQYYNNAVSQQQFNAISQQQLLLHSQQVLKTEMELYQKEMAALGAIKWVRP